MAGSALLYHDKNTLHRLGEDHPDQERRLAVILDLLKEKQEFDPLEFVTLTSIAGPDPRIHPLVSQLHSPEYIEQLIQKSEAGERLGEDTPLKPGSIAAALAAVETAVAAAELVMSGRFTTAFALVRPPGHHAMPDRGGGFCIFNNIVAAVKTALVKFKLTRVAVIDWDAHHGNGTQSFFYESPNVLYISIHQFPAFPGTGMVSETGAGAGKGFTVNIPVPPGTGDAGYYFAFERIVKPIIEQFQPEGIFVSAGQDGHFAEPLTGLNLTTPGFYRMATAVKSLADQVCRGRVVGVLEGGYELETVAYPTAAAIAGLAGIAADFDDPLPKPRDVVLPTARLKIDAALAKQREFWRL